MQHQQKTLQRQAHPPALIQQAPISNYRAVKLLQLEQMHLLMVSRTQGSWQSAFSLASPWLQIKVVPDATMMAVCSMIQIRLCFKVHVSRLTAT